MKKTMNVVSSVILLLGAAILIVMVSAETALTAPLSDGISFGGPSVIGAAGGTVQALVAGDLDHDSDPDLVSGDAGIIAWGNSTTWISQTVGSPGGGAVVYALAIGDLDNDGNLDLVSGSGSGASYEIQVWRNDGTPFDTTWIANNVGATGAEDVTALALGDLDWDGDLDIVSGDSGGVVAIWQNDGTPFSAPWISNTVGITGTVRALAVGDVNRRDRLDIVSADATGGLNAWQNDATPFEGTWKSYQVDAAATDVQALALVDVTGDGYPDIVTGREAGAAYQVAYWENDKHPFFGGTWTLRNVGQPGVDVYAVLVADLDVDGDPDVASGSQVNGSGAEVVVWENNAGTWQGRDVGETGTDVHAVVAADLDRDRDPDLIAGAGQQVVSWPNTRTPIPLGQWTEGPQPLPVHETLSVAVVDFDRDSQLDIAAGTMKEGLDVWAGNGGYTWTLRMDKPLTGVVWSDVAWGQIDNFTDLDLVAAGDEMGLEAWSLAEGGTNWSDISTGLPESGTAAAVALGDIDNDGWLDLGACGLGIGLRGWKGAGTSWTFQGMVSGTLDFCDLALGHVDHDGDLDVVAASCDGHGLPVWEGDGAFGFYYTASPVTTGSYVAVALGDVDNDGHADIVAAPQGGGVAVWQGDEGTGWTALGTISPTLTVLSLDLGDLDNNGYLDIVAGSQDSGVRVWLGDGGTSWSDASANLPTAGTYPDVAFGRVDGDAMLDIVGVESGASGVRVWTAMEPPPGGWTNFQPAGWVQSQQVTCTVQVAAVGSGLDVDSAVYHYSTDGGMSWSSWLSATATGTSGTTAPQVLTATNVPFNQDAAISNTIQFRIRSVSRVTGTSPIYAVGVDTTPPTNPSLSSSTHSTYGWRNERNIRVAWEDAVDETSGIYGYSYVLDSSDATVPDTDEELWWYSESVQVRAPSDGDSWYFHLRTRDRAGNWSPTAVHLGPLRIDTQPPTGCSVTAPITTSYDFFVHWSCEDPDSGVRNYDVEVLEWYAMSSSGWQPAWMATTETSGYHMYVRESAEYFFRVRARDNAGNLSDYVNSDGTRIEYPPTDVDLTLWIDDAAPDREVRKLVPDAEGLADRTWMEVTVRIFPSHYIAEDFNLLLHWPLDPLGDPVSVTMYDNRERTMGETALTWYREVGYIRVPFSGLPNDPYYVVFRFEILPGAAPGVHTLWAEVRVPATGTSNSASFRVTDCVLKLIVTNRTLLFQEFDDWEVKTLLETLHDLFGAVYYVDDYSTDAANWDPYAVTYWAADINDVADEIDDLIEDWANDGRCDAPYLLLVGDDPVLPYFRVNDPTNWEDDYAYSSSHPILNDLTTNDGLFSDAKYADLDDVDWKRRPTDLIVGRIVGFTADDMETFIQSGLEGPDVSNETYIGASWAGGNFDDPHSVQNTVRDFGFDILYDGVGEVWDTVDNDSWLHADLVRAMEQEFAALGFAGHGERHHFTTPEIDSATGNRLSVWASQIDNHSVNGGNYDDTHPVFGFMACRVGFSLASAATDSMIYALAREGASSALASMGLAHGSPDDWGTGPNAEQFVQLFWTNLLPDEGIRTTGDALAWARAQYDAGRWDNTDEKTIMEFNLFGLPWTIMRRIPASASTLAAHRVAAAPCPFSPAFGLPQPTGIADTYAVQATLDSSDHTTDTTTAPGFDLLQVTGLAQSLDAHRPVLPVAALTLTLPADASVIEVAVVPTQSVVISGVNIPMFVPGIPLEGADPGGYEEVPSDAGVYPTSPYTYHVAALADHQRLNLYVTPAVYDPATDQATLYQSVALSVTYQVAAPVVLRDVYLTQAEQPPDQPVVLQGTVMNVGSAPITVTPHISLTGLMGPDFGPQAGSSLSVSPGQGAWLTASYSPTGALPDGEYLAHVSLWKGPDVWAETAVEVNVTGGRITRLRGPDVVWPGGTAVFTVTFENHRSEPLSAVPWLTVKDLDGGIIVSLSGVTQTVPAGGTTTFTLTWPAVPNVQERLTARAVVAEVLADAIGETYGPATWHIDTPRWIYLPLVMRDF